MIILIEGEYQPYERNTAQKMSNLIKKEFNKTVSVRDIEQFYGMEIPDYEKEQRRYEWI